MCQVHQTVHITFDILVVIQAQGKILHRYPKNNKCGSHQVAETTNSKKAVDHLTLSCLFWFCKVFQPLVSNLAVYKSYCKGNTSLVKEDHFEGV